MTPKKKRTYWLVIDKQLSVYRSNHLETMFDTKEEAENVRDSEITDEPLKVLRVTLTASPAGWK